MINNNQVAKVFYTKATPDEIEQFAKTRNERLSKIDAFRGLMVKAALTFVAVSMPLYLSVTIPPIRRIVFGCAIGFSILSILSLIVLIRKGPRQMAEVCDCFMRDVISGACSTAPVYLPEVTKLEKTCEVSWWICFVLALSCIVAALFL